MHEDSTGNPIRIGDRVRWRGQVYTIKAFRPTLNPRIDAIDFVEERHLAEVPDEVSVDLVRCPPVGE